MCGIIAVLGYIYGIKQLYEGLIILQNRGYDSAGICSIMNDEFLIHKFASIKKKNAFEFLQKYIEQHNKAYNIIGHTRWATNGVPNTENSHPHLDYKNRFSLVHNGIIENYRELKNMLINKHGVTFKSQTDTEVVVNLISFYYDKFEDPKKAIECTLNDLEGTWGLVIQFIGEPNKLYCARHGSPLLIGFSNDYVMVASEQSGFSRYINNYICLNNNDLLVLEKSEGKVIFNRIDEYEIRKVTSEKCSLSPDPFPHWTIKEINEQYESSLRAMGMGGRILNDREVKLGGLNSHLSDLIGIDNLIILGCGTSYNAGLYCINLFKKISEFNTVQIFDGSEFNKYDIPKYGKTALILLSQSGETKDLHRCVNIARDNDLLMIGVINVIDSMIARDVNCGVYLNAGKEVGVASTKAFTSQIIILNLIAIWFSQYRCTNEIIRKDLISGLRNLPHDIKRVIKDTENKCIEVAKYLKDRESVFLLGRGNNQAIAKEGALKIKEIGYINSSGYSTASLKHGPYALLEKGFPVIILIPDDNMFGRNNSVGEELKSRSAYVVVITDKEFDEEYSMVIKIPKNKCFFGLLSNICLQLIAYHLAILKGNEVDRPKNLAKSITVY